MKTLNTIALIASLMFGILMTNDAIAAPWVHQGSICHNYVKGQANDFRFYTAAGIRNGATGVRSVICPLVTNQTPSSTTGYVYVQYYKGGFNCTLYSYDDFGNFQGSKTELLPSLAGNGIKYIGTVPNGFFYNHSLVCSLPANYAGGVNAIESNF